MINENTAALEQLIEQAAALKPTILRFTDKETGAIYKVYIVDGDMHISME